MNFAQIGALFLRQGPWAILVELDIGAGRNSQMEIKLSMEILQMAMTIDEARQNGLASDVDHLGIGRNSDFAATADCLEPACLDNDDGILDRRPAGAIDQFSTLHHEYFLCHLFFSFLLPITKLPGVAISPAEILNRVQRSGSSRPAPASICFTI